MDLSRTPTLHLLGTSNETLDRNFRRIDDAFVAKSLSLPLPKTPIDLLSSSPTIGLAYTGDAILNHNFKLTDALFGVTAVAAHGYKGTHQDALNQNFLKIIAAFAAAGVIVPPPDEGAIPKDEPAAKPASEVEVHATKKSTKKGWLS